jgi:osmoprotectant transport system substrate-binding protein
MKRTFILLGILVLTMALVLPGCSKPGIVVGSKIDTEGALLSQMIIAMLQNNGIEAIDKSEFGPTSVVRKAITSGEIDIYPEYTGNGAFFFDEADSDIWKDAQQGFERVKMLDMDANNIVWLKSAPANNTWAIAIPKELAEKEGISSLDDFATYINGDGYVKLIGSEEFVTSPVALPAFQAAYGFTLTENQIVSLSGGNTAQTEKAAAEGTDGVNAAMAYGTDGSLAALGLVVLSDPRNVQPVYEPAPIVRGEIYDQYPELATILDPVFQSLDLETLQALNAKIAFEGQAAADVARDYLIAKEFLK